MQDEVNKIVFNALADGREIWFPGVGSRSRISECLACIGSAVGTSFPAHCLSPLRAAGRFRDRPDCSGGGLRCCCGRRYLFPVARQSPGGGRNLHSGSRGAQSPLLSARFAARCRSQSSRTRSAAAETPIFPATPLSGDRLVLYGGCRLRNLAVRRVDAAAVRGRF